MSKIRNQDSLLHSMAQADAYFTAKNYDKGLKWLAFLLHKYPELLSTHGQAFDSFTALSLKDWHWAWLRMKTELAPGSPCKEMTILQLAGRKFKDPALVLRKEINCYFCGKQALLEELITAGEALEDNASHFTDKALGVLVQGIGFWWGDEEQEKAATVLVKESFKILEDGAEKEKSDAKGPNGVISLINGLISTWYAFCLLKNYHDRAEKDLEFASGLDRKMSPDKYRGVDNAGRVIPAISTLTIYDEVRIADLFIEAINIFYALVQFEESEAKAWINHVGPALVVVTVRLLVHRVAMLNDTYNSIRVWYIAFVLGKWYCLRRLIILSGSELIKMIPDLSSSITSLVDKTCDYVNECWPLSSLAKSYVLRVVLAKSVACLQTRQYEIGLKHLRVLFDFKSSLVDAGGGNIDAICHLVAEAMFVLAQYKALEISHGLKVDMGPLHEKLVAMSPAAIACKACKSISALARNSVVRHGGWQDLGHNYHVLQTITELYPTTLLLIKESGRMRDARVFAADFIYVAQQFCLISRTLQVLLPLIEIELITKSFDTAQHKIECVLKLIDSYKKDDDGEENELPRTGSTFLYDQFASFGMNFAPEDLKKVSYEWQLPEAKAPIRYTCNERRYEKNKKFQWLPSQRIAVPKYLMHPLDCSCYLCRHPFIGCLTIRFLQLQAKYATYGERPGISLSILYCAKFYMARAIARTTSQYYPLSKELQAVVNPKTVKAVVALAHTEWFFKTGMDWITTLMEITPYEDIEMIVKLYNYLLEGIKIYDPSDKLLPMTPLEIMGSALFGYMTKHIPNFVRGADFRETYRAFAITCPQYVVEDDGEKENEENKSISIEFLPSTPPNQQTPKTPVVCAPAAAPKRRGRPPKKK